MEGLFCSVVEGLANGFLRSLAWAGRRDFVAFEDGEVVVRWVRSSWRNGMRVLEVRMGLAEVAEAGVWVAIDVPGDGDGDGEWLRGRIGVVGATLGEGILLKGDMPLVDEPVVVEDVGVGMCE